MTGGSPVAETTSAAQRAPHAGTPAAETIELPLTPAGRPPAARRRTWLALAAVVVAAAAGVGAWLGTRGSPRSGTSPVVTTTVVAVTTGTMRRTVESSGTLEPAHESELSFAVPGVVTAVDVAVGQAVAAGDRLATVAPTALEATEQSAAAALSAAEAQLASDRSGGAAASQIESDEAAVTSAESQLSSAQGDVADATLTSPIAGTVAAVNLSVGQHVGGTGAGGGAPGGGTTGGTSTSGSGSTDDSSAQVVVVSTDAFLVDTSANATQVGSLSAGQQATVTPSGTDRVLPATVASVGLIASSGSGVASFPVVLEVTGSPSGLYAGTSASVSIDVEQLHHVTEVPTGAISYSGGVARVVLTEDGRHVPSTVTTGLTTGGMTQITSGLHVGAHVVERIVTFTAPTSTGGDRLLGPGAGQFDKRIPEGSGATGNPQGVIVKGAPGGTRG